MTQSHTAFSPSHYLFACLLAAFFIGRTALPAAGVNDRPLPAGVWLGEEREVQSVKGIQKCTVGYPEAEAGSLTYEPTDPFEPGLYELTISVRPSHAYDAIAWNGTLRLSIRGGRLLNAGEWRVVDFARPNQPETRTARFVVDRRSSVAFELTAAITPDAFENQRATEAVKQQELTQPGQLLGGDDAALNAADMGVFAQLSPKNHFYFVLDNANVRQRSASAYIEAVSVDKIRYQPGDTLNAEVVLHNIAADAKGTLRLFLETGVSDRETVGERELAPGRAGVERTETFTFKLPADAALGYGLVAQWSSGNDSSEAAAYFTVTDNIYRTAIIQAHPVHSQTTGDENRSYDRYGAGLKNAYVNTREIFFWAEEDMVELSPSTDYWFSGQTGYHMSRDGLKALIDAYHKHGVAVTTYTKFVLSGFLGWEFAYDHPFEHKNQYRFPVGMWEGTNVPALDSFRNKEFIVVSGNIGGLFEPGIGYSPFMPINPDPMPANVRRAAEEVKRSIAMFEWDGCRWDGHPRGNVPGGNSTGGKSPEKYNRRGHLQTQALVRYFKEIIAEDYPRFQHGYNYLFATADPTYDWAIEDYELDELAHGGGLLMNESIGNHGFGQRFGWYAANIQEEADLARERGGFYLAIHRAENPRDEMLCYILGYAGGARSYGATPGMAKLNRYATRFADFVFNENLRRLTRPETILKPSAATEQLRWTDFVFETPHAGGRTKLVVNLLNIDMDALISPKYAAGADQSLWPGNEPVQLTTNLPNGYGLQAAHLIDPFTLDVQLAEVQGSAILIPSVALWRVLVLDLTVADDTPALAEQLGPPATVGKKRSQSDDVPAPIEPPPTRDVTEVNLRMADLFAAVGDTSWWQEPADFASLSWQDRNERILARQMPIEHYLKSYPYGLRLPDDLERKDSPPSFGNLTPARNGVLDVFLAAGAMSHRLRLYEALAGIERMQVHEARYDAPFSGKHHGLLNNVSPGSLSKHDVLIYTDIPHAAIGVEQAYAMVDYVKQGGAVLFFGGEYSFGKGRYDHTILDRELLPVDVVEPNDTRYTEAPLALEPGPDWDELGSDIGFAEKPVLWSWNAVALRPDAPVKVFLQAGNRPILVGWELGKGRVACFLSTQRGTSDKEHLAFFDWDSWPILMRAVAQWLAPNAGKTDPPAPTITSAEFDKVRQELAGAAMEQMMNFSTTDDTDNLLDAPSPAGATGAAAENLDRQDLADRAGTLRQLLRAAGPEAGKLAAEQLVAVSNLPQHLRIQLIQFVSNNRPPNLVQIGKGALADPSPAVRGAAYCLLALAGDPEYIDIMNDPSPAFETDRTARRRNLAIAAALFQGEELLTFARQRVKDWNRQEEQNKKTYTGGEGFSMKAPAKPLLDTESLLARVGFLAYLAQHDATYAGQFVQEWGRLPQYVDFCNRAAASTRKGMTQTGAEGRREGQRRLEQLHLYREHLEQMDGLTAEAARRTYRAHPEETAEALRDGHFLQELKRIINLLGAIPPAKTPEQHSILLEARHPFLRRFAGARPR